MCVTAFFNIKSIFFISVYYRKKIRCLLRKTARVENGYDQMHCSPLLFCMNLEFWQITSQIQGNFLNKQVKMTKCFYLYVCNFVLLTADVAFHCTSVGSVIFSKHKMGHY